MSDVIIGSMSSDSSVNQPSPYTFSNFLWLTLAVFVIYYTDIINTLLDDVTIYRSVDVLCAVVAIYIAAYGHRFIRTGRIPLSP